MAHHTAVGHRPRRVRAARVTQGASAADSGVVAALCILRNMGRPLSRAPSTSWCDAAPRPQQGQPFSRDFVSS
eukprot:3670528-Prymnesium_polylepis.1